MNFKTSSSNMFNSFLRCPNYMSPGNYDIRYCFQVKLMARGKKAESSQNYHMYLCISEKNRGLFSSSICAQKLKSRVCNPSLAFCIKKLDLKASLLVLNCYNMQHPDEAETGLSTFETQLLTDITLFIPDLHERWMLWIPLPFRSLPATNLSEAPGLL